MKFFAAAALILSGSMAAAFSACPEGGLFTNAVCCDTDVAGVVGIGCETGQSPCHRQTMLFRPGR